MEHPFLPAGGFSVRLPGVPQEKTRPVTLVNHPVTLHEYPAPAGDLTYVAGYADTPPGVRSALSPDELLTAARTDYEAILGGRVVDARPLTDKPFPGREWRLDVAGAGPPERLRRATSISSRAASSTSPQPAALLRPARLRRGETLRLV